MQAYWLFVDFDNTLMATEQHALPSLIARFNTLYVEQVGRALTLYEFKQHFHGQARTTLCRNLSEYFNIVVDEKKLYEAREERMMEYLQALPDGVTMASHLLETLCTLKAKGACLALVSNNPVQRALCAMRFASNQQGEQLAELFGTRLFEAGVIQKPAPDVYLQAITQLNACVERSFAVEDSVSGAKAAIAAGLTTFAFTGFSEDQEAAAKELLAIGCKEAFNDWRQLPLLLQA